MYRYQVYGLNVASEVPLPELLPQDFSQQADVHVTLGDVDTDQMKMWFGLDGSDFLIRIDEIANYRVRGGESIVISPFQDDWQKIRVFLLGSAFGALLFQRGLTPLHGSALEVDGSACIITGESGAGKSTLAHAFTQKGFRLVTDDVAAIEVSDDGQPHLYSAYPQQKLWQQSLDLLARTNAGLQTIWGDETKYRIPLDATFFRGRLPFRTLFRLSKSEATDAPIIRPVSGGKKLQVLLDETYRSFFAGVMGLHESHFRMCTQMVHHIRMFELIRPMTGAHPHDLVDLVVNIVRDA